MGGELMQAGPRAKRQPAWHMLASEFRDATLNEKGSGEFDPSFVITKLGAKVNRVIVAGLLERLEVRETANGSTLYQGQLRDPSGQHYFSVGDYASEAMRELTTTLTARIEVGEPELVLMVAKARWYQTEEGAVYTSLRPEEACIIDGKTYANWITRACQGTIERMNAFSASLDLEPTEQAYSASENIPANLVEGLVTSRNHYGEIDLEQYKLNIMQALDIAEGKMSSATKPVPIPIASATEEGDDAAEGSDLEECILSLIRQLDQGDGVDFEAVLSNANARGFSRPDSEAMLDELSEKGVVHEPKFGWFKIVE
jgi:RPA family protein|tara:strand:+ start:1131 stop:2072 length:942 start_codon:yes stop_codon:yes gene_type:complete